jgi:hypothetical protein
VIRSAIPDKKRPLKNQGSFFIVGTTRFELATPCTPCKCATGLRYVPNFLGNTSLNLSGKYPHQRREYLPNNWGGKCSTKWAELETNSTLLYFPATSYKTTPVTSLIFAKVNSLANFTNSLNKYACFVMPFEQHI